MRRLLVVTAVMLLSNTGGAQTQVTVNIDRQPGWGPVGNDYVEYYYLPDLEAYYHVPQHRFYFLEKGRWVGRSSLPGRYRRYDLTKGYKIVVNEEKPYRNHNSNREKYSSFRGRGGQGPIRESRDPKYFVNKNHPEHGNWMKQQKHNKRNSGKKSRPN